MRFIISFHMLRYNLVNVCLCVHQEAFSSPCVSYTTSAQCVNVYLNQRKEWRDRGWYEERERTAEEIKRKVKGKGQPLG